MWFDSCCFEAQNKFVCQSKAQCKKRIAREYTKNNMLISRLLRDNED